MKNTSLKRYGVSLYKSGLIYLLVSTSFFLVFSCQNPEKKDKMIETELQNKILKIHDKLMIKMDTTMVLQSELKKIKVNGDSPKSIEIKTIFKNLDSGNNEMMNWMNNYKLDYKGKNHNENMKYLNSQYNEVSNINSFLVNSLSQANSLLRKQK
jgi:predicted SAM-dependent methyltransferase